jgi:uncharacterized membrane protein YgcG
VKKTLTTIILLASLAVVSAQSSFDWTRYGFKAEPIGVSVGTPCVLNLVSRFWYRNFGVSACGIYLPPGMNFLNGSGVEADVMYKFILPGRRQMVAPYVALGYGNSQVSSAVGGKTITLTMNNYVGLQVGAYYGGAFAQVGFGVGKFKVSNSPTMSVFPLIQAGYLMSLGGSSSGGSSGGGSGGGGSGGGGSGGGKK